MGSESMLAINENSVYVGAVHKSMSLIRISEEILGAVVGLDEVLDSTLWTPDLGLPRRFPF